MAPASCGWARRRTRRRRALHHARTPCSRHARRMHAACTPHAHTMHTPCTHHAHAMHTPCTPRAHCVHVACTHRARGRHEACCVAHAQLLSLCPTCSLLSPCPILSCSSPYLLLTMPHAQLLSPSLCSARSHPTPHAQACELGAPCLTKPHPTPCSPCPMPHHAPPYHPLRRRASWAPPSRAPRSSPPRC